MSQILENSKKDMDKTIETLNHRFATVRAGRANPSSLDGVMVEYYGTPTPLKSFPLNESPKAKSFKTSLFLLTFMLGKTILLILIVGIALIVGLEFLLNLNDPMSAIIFIFAAGVQSNRKNTKASDMHINIYEEYFEQYYKFETIREGLRGEFRYKFQYAKSKTFETKKILAIKTRVNGQISAMILTKDDKNEAIDTIKEKIKAAKKKD